MLSLKQSAGDSTELGGLSSDLHASDRNQFRNA